MSLVMNPRSVAIEFPASSAVRGSATCVRT